MDYSATPTPELFTSASPAASATGSATFLVIALLSLALCIALIAAVWKIYAKAGQHGWAVLVPIYNMLVLLRIIGRPAWWLLLLFIPFVNLIISLIMSLDLAKAFGRSTVFGVVGLFLFSTIGYLILGFDKSQYQGPSGQAPAEPVPSQPAAPAAA